MWLFSVGDDDVDGVSWSGHSIEVSAVLYHSLYALFHQYFSPCLMLSFGAVVFFKFSLSQPKELCLFLLTLLPIPPGHSKLCGAHLLAGPEL